MLKMRHGKVYDVSTLKGAYEMYLTYKGETYTKWVVNPAYLYDEGEELVDMVIELWGLDNCKEVRDILYEDLDFEWVERAYLPVHVEQRLQEEESYLVEEIDYEY